MSDLYMNEWKAFLSELEAAPKKAVASLDKFRKDMLGGGAKSSAPFTQDGFPKDFNKPEEFSAPAMEEADVEEDKLFKPLSKSQKAHSSKLIRVKYKDRPLDADGVIDPKVAKGEKESLDEIKMDQVMPRFDSKAFKNAMEQKYDVPPGRLELLKRREPKGIRDMVPGDIEEKYKPEALNWLITTYINDPEFKSSLYHNFFINKNSIRKNIETFFQIKQVKPSLLSKNDIYSIKTIQEFEEVVEAAKPAWQEYKQEKESKDASLGTNKIYEDDNWEVFIPENKGAACKLGKGTEWCTAAPGLEYYSHYHKKDDPLIIFISKQDPSEKYQFHYGTKQFMDKDDVQLDEVDEGEKFFQLHSIVANSDKVPEQIRQQAKLRAKGYQKLPNGGYSLKYIYRGNLREEYYNQNGNLDREDGPAVIEYQNNGNVDTEMWYRNGLLYRKGEPALIYYSEDTGEPYWKVWYEAGSGLKHRNNGPASVREYTPATVDDEGEWQPAGEKTVDAEYFWQGKKVSKEEYERLSSENQQKNKSLQEMIKEEIMNLLYEKKDRCYNIAKRKYKAFPSAYASGAIVKCRQGKIWKKEK